MQWPKEFNHHEIRISDALARADFEKLLGFKIHRDSVRLPQKAYEQHAAAIQAIQMSAAFRLSLNT